MKALLSQGRAAFRGFLKQKQAKCPQPKKFVDLIVINQNFRVFCAAFRGVFWNQDKKIIIG